MQCAQNIAIDLPQKVMVNEDANHLVWLSYNNPDYLMKRHNVKGCDGVFNKISGLLKKLAKSTISK